MRKFAAVFLLLLAIPLITAHACAQSGGGGSNYGTPPKLAIDSSGTVAVVGLRTCKITFRGGDITTEGCDFSLPLRNPKMTPIDTQHVKFEFDQSTLGVSSLITPYRDQAR